MKNILVTGGAGYIGSNIIRVLIKKKLNVISLDNLSTGHKKLIHPKSFFYRSDILDFNRIKKIIKNHNIDSIIHCAAKLNVNESQKRPKFYFQNNVKGTKILLDACVDTNIKNFLFSSSCAVYGDKKKIPIEEIATTKPVSNYGKTKLKAEKLIKKYFKGNIAILRYFNVVGASSDNKFGQINKNGQLFKNLSLEVLKKKPIISVFGNNYKTKDGTCLRDYIHVEDLANIHVEILKNMFATNMSGIFNCGYGKPYSVIEIIRVFEKITKKKIKIVIKKKRNGDIEKIYANNNKISKRIKYNFKFKNLKKIINSCILWEKKLNCV